MTFPREECRFRMKRTVMATFLVTLWFVVFTAIGLAQVHGMETPSNRAAVETRLQAAPGENFLVAGVFNKLLQAFMKSGRKASKNADDVMEGSGTLSRGADDAPAATSHMERKTGGEKAAEEDGALEELYFHMRSVCNRREREENATKCRDLFKDENNNGIRGAR